MITNPDGSITGWSFGDGSHIQSQFKIFADNFSVTSSDGSFTPFEIKNRDVYFRGTLHADRIESHTITNSKLAYFTLSSSRVFSMVKNGNGSQLSYTTLVIPPRSRMFIFGAQTFHGTSNNDSSLQIDKYNSGIWLEEEYNSSSRWVIQHSMGWANGIICTGTANYIADSVTNYSYSRYLYLKLGCEAYATNIRNFYWETRVTAIIFRA